jgi:integrase/recombinase XerD
MAAKGRKRKPPAHIGDVSDPQGFDRLSDAFYEWMRVKGYSEQTVVHRADFLRTFMLWCVERGITRPNEATRPILERYQRHLYHYRKRDGRPLSFRSQFAHLVPIRAFFKWLARQNYLLYNPASELELPKVEKRLPRSVLSANEAEAVLAQPDISEPLGIRDRAILETLYSTGIRRMELINLSLYCLDTERGTMMIREGKGKKDRMVPVGERATAWIDKYLDDVRPSLVVEPDEAVLFLTLEGESFAPNRLSQLVRNYVNAADIGKRGSCHLFRHTMATLMLEGGADIRYIQAMLGHAELSTTQIYTQVSIRKLKEIHTATHPGARLGRHEGASEHHAEDVEKVDTPNKDGGDRAEPGGV